MYSTKKNPTAMLSMTAMIATAVGYKVWSINQLFSVGFSKTEIGVKK